MKKSARFMKAAGCILLWLSLAGCAYSDILDQVPRDFAYSAQAPQQEQDSARDPQASQQGQDSARDLQASQQEQDSAMDSQASQQERNSARDLQQAQGSAQLPKQLSQSSAQEGLAPQGTGLGDSFLAEEAGDFACRALNGAEEVWYHEMEEILGSFGEKVRLSEECLKAGLSEKDIDRIFQCVLNDHPELFYVEGYSYSKYTKGSMLTAIVFSGTYGMDRETAILRRQEIEQAAEQILAGISAEASDYDKVKYVYETLIASTDYELQSPDNQNIYSVLVNHRSVCQGYAKATQYLLNRLGVECTLVLGTVENGEGHAWNLVKVDGSYYYVDTTWGDASYQLGETQASAGSAMPAINYDYLNITTRELLRTHTVRGVVPMPVCTAKEANFYVREGAWFEAFDSESVRELFARASAEGRTDVTVKCADAACYEEMTEALVTGQKIFDYWEDAGSHIAYAKNENQLSLTFWVTNE